MPTSSLENVESGLYDDLIIAIGCLIAIPTSLHCNRISDAVLHNSLMSDTNWVDSYRIAAAV